tara:strand:- start:249 stop:962 length:714 start_codon:yes stop_codon:yes gene_type:complete
MADYLPSITLPPERPSIQEETETLDNDSEPEESEPEELEPEEVDYGDPAEEILPEAVPRRAKIPQEEIFATPPVVQPIADAPAKRVKQTRAKRGPPNEKQLAGLALGREKAKATRERKKILKQELAAQTQSDKKLVEDVREKERNKLRKRLGQEDTPVEPVVQIVEKERIVEKGYTQEQLDAAVAKAVDQSVSRVEDLRKQRKELKRKTQAKANHDAKIFKDINTSLKRDAWADCFI